MKRFETVIRIITEGEDRFEAGDKAGELLCMEFIQDQNMVISCEPTRPIVAKPIRPSQPYILDVC